MPLEVPSWTFLELPEVSIGMSSPFMDCYLGFQVLIEWYGVSSVFKWSSWYVEEMTTQCAVGKLLPPSYMQSKQAVTACAYLIYGRSLLAFDFVIPASYPLVRSTCNCEFWFLCRQGAPRKRKGPVKGTKGRERFRTEEAFYTNPNPDCLCMQSDSHDNNGNVQNNLFSWESGHTGESHLESRGALVERS